ANLSECPRACGGTRCSTFETWRSADRRRLPRAGESYLRLHITVRKGEWIAGSYSYWQPGRGRTRERNSPHDRLSDTRLSDTRLSNKRQEGPGIGTAAQDFR